MRCRRIALLGLILALGVVSCTANEPPAATSAGFVNPQVSPDPSETPLNPTLTEAPPTVSTIPTLTQSVLLPTLTPSSRPTATPLACWQSGGNLEESQLATEQLKKPLEYLVYLPPCYAAQPVRRYPTVYLIHGQTYGNDHWLGLGAAEITNRLIANGEMAPFIMVFPYDRDHYLPPSQNLFGEVVLQELIPLIDQTYRTLSERDFRAIGGISRGGNWAIHLGLQHPETFGAIGAHSAPVFSTDTNPEIIAWLQAIPLAEMPSLFVDTGKNDRWLQYTLTFEQILSDEGIPHEWHLYPGFHEDDYWQAHLEEYLRWYAREW